MYYPKIYNMKTYIFCCLLTFSLFVPSPVAAWEGIVTNVHDGLGVAVWWVYLMLPRLMPMKT